MWRSMYSPVPGIQLRPRMAGEGRELEGKQSLDVQGPGLVLPVGLGPDPGPPPLADEERAHSKSESPEGEEVEWSEVHGSIQRNIRIRSVLTAAANAPTGAHRGRWFKYPLSATCASSITFQDFLCPDEGGLGEGPAVDHRGIVPVGPDFNQLDLWSEMSKPKIQFWPDG